MTYRETGGPTPYEKQLRDIVLSRRSALGPWLVTGLGITLALFLSYLVYANVLTPVAPVASPERSLRLLTNATPAAATPQLAPTSPLPAPIWGPAMTSVPQSRATDALLGG